MKGYRQRLVRFPKDSTVRYTSGMGFPFTARVLVAHLDGSRTIRVLWRIGADGQEMTGGGYYGQKHRVGPDQLAEWEG